MITQLKTHLKTFGTSILIISVASFATTSYVIIEAMLDLLTTLVDKGSLTQGSYALMVSASKTDRA